MSDDSGGGSGGEGGGTIADRHDRRNTSPPPEHVSFELDDAAVVVAADSRINANTSKSKSQTMTITRTQSLLPHSLPFLDSASLLTHYAFTPISPHPLPSLLSSLTAGLFSTKVCLAPIASVWSWLFAAPPSTTNTTTAVATVTDSSTGSDSRDRWNLCPSLLLSWTFSHLELFDLVRLRSVCQSFNDLLVSHPFAPICYHSASLSLPPTARWTTRGLNELFVSVPYLSALSFAPLQEDLAVTMEEVQKQTHSQNGLQPVSHPSMLMDPRRLHFHSVLRLNYLRVLLLANLNFSLTDEDLFSLSAHLPVLEMLAIAAPSSSQSLSAVGFSHLSVMKHLAHIDIHYDTSTQSRTTARPLAASNVTLSDSSTGRVTTSSSDIDDAESSVRSDMINKQECWLALLRSRSLSVFQLTRIDRPVDEISVWNKRRKDRQKNRMSGSLSGVGDSETSPPTSSRRASLPIVSVLESLTLDSPTLLSLPSSSTFSFSLFFSSFSSTLQSLTFHSKPSHVSDAVLYKEIEHAVVRALPSFQSLLSLSLSLSSLTVNQLTVLSSSSLSQSLVSLSLARSFVLNEDLYSNEALSVPLSSSVNSLQAAWDDITSEDFNAFLVSFKRLASLSLARLPFVVDSSFVSLITGITSPLHSLSLSLLPVSASSLSILLNHPTLLYLDIHVHPKLWESAERGEMSAVDANVWRSLSSKHKEFNKRFRLSRMSCEDEEELEITERRRQEKLSRRMRREWLRWKIISEGDWIDAEDIEEIETELNDSDDDTGSSTKSISQKLLVNPRDENSEQQLASMTECWSQLFYAQCLAAGDHVEQLKARERWLQENALENMSSSEGRDDDGPHDFDGEGETKENVDEPEGSTNSETRGIGRSPSPAASVELAQLDQLVTESKEAQEVDPL